MEGLNLLLNGFANSFTTVNLAACFIGALIGTVVGVLFLVVAIHRFRTTVDEHRDRRTKDGTHEEQRSAEAPPFRTW